MPRRASAAFLPSTVFSDGLVLQRDSPIHVTGRARPGAEVRAAFVRLDGSRAGSSARTGDDGRFTVVLPPQAASDEPATLELACGRASRTIADVLVGEVWLTGGESNMAFPVSACPTRDREALSGGAGASCIRYFRQAPSGVRSGSVLYPMEPAEDVVDGRWVRAGSDGAGEASAIASAFATCLRARLKVPVGILSTEAPGATVFSFLSREALASDASLAEHLRQTGEYRDASTWNLSGDWNDRQPSALHNAKVAPLSGSALRGFLWAQGESDWYRPAPHRRAQLAMVADWTRRFRRPDGPATHVFLHVLPSPHHYGPDPDALPLLVEASATLWRDLPCRAAAVAVHDLPPEWESAPAPWRHPSRPVHKAAVGRRLAQLALGIAYGAPVPAASPECTAIEIVGGKAMLTFDPSGQGLRLREGDATLRGFSICGADRVFVEAESRLLHGVRAMAWSDAVPVPVAVAYGFHAMNGDCGLQTRDGLAVVPFRSDRVPSRHYRPTPWMHCDALETWGYARDGSSAGRIPLWTAGPGVRLSLDRGIRSEGEASLRLDYRAEPHADASADSCLFHVSPATDPASAYAPFDWSGFSYLALELFSPDLQEKEFLAPLLLSTDGTAHPLRPPDGAPAVRIPPGLAWRTLRFPLACAEAVLPRVSGLRLSFRDPKGRGALHLDNLRLER